MKTGQGVRDVALEIARPDGTSLSPSINYHALRDEADRITGLVISFRDTTRRDRVHRSLVESQEHSLRRWPTSSRDCRARKRRPDTNAVFVFHALAPEDEVLVQVSTPLEDVLAAMPEDARQVAREDLAAVARGERDTVVQRHRYDYETGPVWVETRLRAVRDGDGELLCIRGTSQDVTEQEQAKQEVTTQSALLDEVDVAVVATDLDGRVTHWNRGPSDSTAGATARPRARRRRVSRRAGDERPASWSPSSAAEGTGRASAGRAQGRLDVPAYLRGRMMLDRDGRPAGWIGVTVDMSKRLEAERALRAAGNYLRAVADNVGEGLFTLDTDGCLTT